MSPILVALVTGLVGLAFVGWTATRVLAHDRGTEEMIRLGNAIQEGANAFLMAEYRVLSIFVVVVAAVLGLFIGWSTAIAFIVGALLSAAAGNVGMNIAVRANVRTAAAARTSLNEGLRVAFGSGTVMGMSVVSLGLVGLAALTLFFGATREAIEIVTGGGYLMAPIALCSLLLVAFALERTLSLRRGRVIPRPFVRRFRQQLREGDLDQEQATELCRDNGSPVSEVGEPMPAPSVTSSNWPPRLRNKRLPP